MNKLSLQRWFIITLVVTLAIKLYLANLIPMSGDEAYFLIWGKQPDYGFYDHPPMVGWLLQLMLHFGEAEWILRLPIILLSTIIGIGIYYILKNEDREKAYLVALLFLASPINVLNVLITTDTPLILWSFLSGIALYTALRTGKLGWYVFSGVGLGLAFLSKYFSVLLGLAYLVYFIFSPKEKKKTIGFVLLYASIIPFVALNLYWNYNHCWANIMFNLYNRNQGEAFSIGKPLTYLVLHLYLMSPVVMYFLIKRRDQVRELFRNSTTALFGFIFVVPMIVFALLTAKKMIGLHWVLSFYPFLYLALGYIFTGEQLRKSLKFMVAFTALHLLAIAVIAELPMSTWKHSSKYDGIVFMFKTDELVKAIKPYEQDFELTTDGYSPSAIISYHYGKNFGVFGEASSHARHDDIVTDFRKMAGHNILILRKTAPSLREYQSYFQAVEVKTIMVRNVPFYLVLGYRFDYPLYRENILRKVRDEYYDIPAFLPMGHCYFCERYFPGEPCPRR